MEHSYEYSILQFVPDQIRGERINIGIVIFSNNQFEIRTADFAEKLRAFGNKINSDHIYSAINSIKKYSDLIADENKNENFQIHEKFIRLAKGFSFDLSSLGRFSVDGPNSFEINCNSIIEKFVSPNKQEKGYKRKNDTIYSELKKIFKKSRVLASELDTIDSQRILTQYEIERGVIASMLLKSNKINILETISAISDDIGINKPIAEIAKSLLVFQSAKFKYNDTAIAPILLYAMNSKIENQISNSLAATESSGVKLVNWNSDIQKYKIIDDLLINAIPLEIPTPKAHGSQKLLN